MGRAGGVRRVARSPSRGVPGSIASSGATDSCRCRCSCRSRPPHPRREPLPDGTTRRLETGTLSTTLTTFTLGGPADTWGRTWNAADLADASFRLRVINVASSTSRDFFLDAVAVRPHATTSGPATLSALSVNPSSTVGGTSSTGTATLTVAAPAGGVVVSLSSGNAVVSVPANVTIAAGATTATFAASTSTVAASTPVTITAIYAGVTRTTTLTVNPASQAAALTVTATGRSGERVTSSPGGDQTWPSAAPPRRRLRWAPRSRSA